MQENSNQNSTAQNEIPVKPDLGQQEAQTPPNIEVTPPVEQQQPVQQKPRSLVPFIMAAILIIAIAAGAYLMLANSRKNQYQPPATQTPSATPAPTPLTTSNADSVLNQTDANIGSTLDQTNLDLNTMGNINAQQDNPNTF